MFYDLDALVADVGVLSGELDGVVEETSGVQTSNKTKLTSNSYPSSVKFYSTKFKLLNAISHSANLIITASLLLRSITGLTKNTKNETGKRKC